MDQLDICKVDPWVATVSQLTEISEPEGIELSRLCMQPLSKLPSLKSAQFSRTKRIISRSRHSRTQTCFHSTVFCWASHIARTSFACLQMSSDLVQAWQDLSKETCEEQEKEMDIIWNKENFMEAPRSPHTATSPKAIYLSPCQLAATEAVQSCRFRKTCVRPTILSIFIHCVWNLDEFGSSMTIDLWKETCEEQKVEMDIIWNKENFMEAPRSPHTATSPKAIYLSPCQPAETVWLHHWFGQLGDQTEVG